MLTNDQEDEHKWLWHFNVYFEILKTKPVRLEIHLSNGAKGNESWILTWSIYKCVLSCGFIVFKEMLIALNHFMIVCHPQSLA